jgi:hypothetical protein
MSFSFSPKINQKFDRVHLKTRARVLKPTILLKIPSSFLFNSPVAKLYYFPIDECVNWGVTAVVYLININCLSKNIKETSYLSNLIIIQYCTYSCGR